jgi:hypothetical protein
MVTAVMEGADGREFVYTIYVHVYVWYEHILETAFLFTAVFGHAFGHGCSWSRRRLAQGSGPCTSPPTRARVAALQAVRRSAQRTAGPSAGRAFRAGAGSSPASRLWCAARHGTARHGTVKGSAWYTARHGTARCGTVRSVRHGTARHGTIRHAARLLSFASVGSSWRPLPARPAGAARRSAGAACVADQGGLAQDRHDDPVPQRLPPRTVAAPPPPAPHLPPVSRCRDCHFCPPLSCATSVLCRGEARSRLLMVAAALGHGRFGHDC